MTEVKIRIILSLEIMQRETIAQYLARYRSHRYHWSTVHTMDKDKRELLLDPKAPAEQSKIEHL